MNSLWSGKSILMWLLWPFSLLFSVIVLVRRWLYHTEVLSRWHAPVPVIVVGNLTVGGNGKTPFVLWLVKQLSKRGYRVGVVSRGYGGRSKRYPLVLTPETTPCEAGDEPVLIYQRTGVPVAVAPNRPDAVKALLEQEPVDIIVSDDGLQHYALGRDKEVVVIDSQFGLGNGFMLPAGPLREGRSRLSSVDLIVINGEDNEIVLPNTIRNTRMRIKPTEAVNIRTGERCIASQLPAVNAMAGIGRPERFFSLLQQMGIPLEKSHSFPDHHAYTADELNTLIKPHETLLMTEKDAVKCRHFAQSNWWYLPIDAEIEDSIVDVLLSNLDKRQKKE